MKTKMILILVLLLLPYAQPVRAREVEQNVYLPLVVNTHEQHIFATGDSKSIGYVSNLLDILPGEWKIDTFPRSGATTAEFITTMNVDILNANFVPNYILINLGANDVNWQYMSEETIKTAYAYILDTYHIVWPSAWIGIMQIWRRGCDTNSDLYNAWITDVIASRPWVHLGPDERIFLANGDNGITYTVDGIHPNTAGWVLTAEEWAQILEQVQPQY